MLNQSWLSVLRAIAGIEPSAGERDSYGRAGALLRFAVPSR